jgi:hypothetical protein
MGSHLDALDIRPGVVAGGEPAALDAVGVNNQSALENPAARLTCERQ